MLNLKFVILRYLSKLCASLALKSKAANRKQAEKCRKKQKQVFLKALALQAEAVKQVEQDTITLEQARAEAIARVNMEYNKKIAGLQVSIDAAQERTTKEHDKVLAYLQQCPPCFK
jgi:maltodextrin utilization protein YvdJ